MQVVLCVCRLWKMSRHRDSETPLASDNLTTARTSDDSGGDQGALLEDAYPFALVLRLRVLQIVCGISGTVMGTVACIEERGDLNLGLAVPAGCVTVLAAGTYTSTLTSYINLGLAVPAGCVTVLAAGTYTYTLTSYSSYTLVSYHSQPGAGSTRRLRHRSRCRYIHLYTHLIQ
ncbi:hypothetical protein PR048_007411 [Dryococelus australis]|uniref:Uncharacterized protein n=1 Tax=Dryococelus australis TaxID=614101 RepID=A0ABQ9HU59_9NEOP|nr:hypothetical protein PR048_007411 [Dryococelus australis]